MIIYAWEEYIGGYVATYIYRERGGCGGTWFSGLDLTRQLAKCNLDWQSGHHLKGVVKMSLFPHFLLNAYIILPFSLSKKMWFSHLFHRQLAQIDISFSHKKKL